MIPDKEKILDRNGFDFEAFKYENEYSAKNLLIGIDDIAKEVAIGYDRWKIENGWEWSAAKMARGEEKIWYVMAGDGIYLTDEQLFDQYLIHLQSLNKQQH